MTDEERCEAFKAELIELCAKHGAKLSVDVYEWLNVRIGTASLDICDNEGRWEGDRVALLQAAQRAEVVKREDAEMYDPLRDE